MIRTLTVMGQINLWDDKRMEFVDSDFDAVKNKITLTLLFRDSHGEEFSVDKLKIYGVKNMDKASLTFGTIIKTIELIDLTRKNEIRLCDKQGKTIQVIECDKYEFNHKKVRTA